jgi:hypothetical protein
MVGFVLRGVSCITDLIKLLQSSGNNVFLKMIVEVHDFHIIISFILPGTFEMKSMCSSKHAC